jgi:predicted hydrolase (HD superfamily)
MTRAEAWQVVCEWTESDSLRKHMLAVEAAMRLYARKFGEDEEEWGIVGLLHDFDYERFPNEGGHPYPGVAHLQSLGVPESWTNAILAHCEFTGVEPKSLLAKTLLACDELTGLITATTYVQPTKKIDDLKPSSVQKRMKEAAFARKINREDIVRGAGLIEVPLDEHIVNVVEAMRGVAGELGL